MTAEEAYDFLVSAGYKDAVALKFSEDRFVLGQWLPLAQLKDGFILRTKPEEGQAVRVLGEGACWVTAMRATGHWQEFTVWKSKQEPDPPVVTKVRQKTVKP